MSLALARRARSLERTLIRQVFDAAPPDAINLGLGQPDLPTPPEISLAGIGGIASGETSYGPTAGIGELRAAVAADYAPWAEGPANVLITIGSQEAMTVACATLLDPGDELLYPDPGYPAYPVVAALFGARGVPYPLSPERGFRLHPPDVVERLRERTRLVVVTEPSNPTGAISDPADLRELVELLEGHNVAWVSDEIYAGFAFEREALSLSRFGSHGVVVSGLSKDTSMTGWRLGWLVGPAELIARATAVHQYLVTCAPRISQRAALAAFTPEGRAARTRLVERFRQRRALMADALERSGVLEVTPPDGAFYFFVDIARYGDSLAVARRLLERCKVITIPGVAFGAGGEGFLRLSFAAAEAEIVEGVRRIGEELSR